MRPIRQGERGKSVDRGVVDVTLLAVLVELKRANVQVGGHNKSGVLPACGEGRRTGIEKTSILRCDDTIWMAVATSSSRLPVKPPLQVAC